MEAANRTPEPYGWFYEYFDKPWQNERRMLVFEKLSKRPFVKMLKAYQPDIINKLVSF
jgi:hypothetical protein